MSQPTPHYTEDDLKRVIARDFPAKSVTEVMTLLASYGAESWQREILRVQMACLKCANGDVIGLRRAVSRACSDYRDVLAEAEYPEYMHAHGPEAQKTAIESDWRQLQAWLNRS
jgi:hypothetical protein